MSFLRNVLTDLVEKKLWPFAAALVLALVAVPVVLGGGSAATPAADVASSGATPAHSATPASEVVTVSDPATAAKVQRGGAVHNPFVQHHLPKPEATAPVAGTLGTTTTSAVTDAVNTTKTLVDAFTGGGTSSGGSSTTTDTTTSTSGGSGTTTTPDKTTSSTTTKSSTYHVALRFGEAGAAKTYRNVARLTPLPSSDNPFFVFLGLSDDAKSAVFLIDSDAVPSGDGTCQPSADDCETVELKVGDTEFFDLQTGTAGIVQYQLDLTSIRKFPAPSAAVAAKAHARESSAGREVLRATVASTPGILDAWDYSQHTGLLVDRSSTVADADVAHLPAGIADAVDGDQPDAASVATPASAPQE